MQDTLDLWSWRRTIADLYREIREDPAPEHAWRRWCDIRRQLFCGHPQSPIEADERAAYTGPTVFDYDPALRLRVQVQPASAETRVIAVGADGEATLSAFARTAGLQQRLGGELTLYWIEGYGGGLLLPFADATSGAETYGGGRYLIDSIKGADPCVPEADGSMTLDFNFAYNPSCAYSPRWVCPLAPPGNRLPGAVRAGERLG